MMKRGWLILVAVVFGLGAVAQKGEIQLNISPQRSMEYVLDGRERLNNRALVLPAGEHRFTFWAPDRKILDTTLTIIADTSIAFYKTLTPTEAYLTYQRDLKRIKHQRLFLRSLPVLATAVCAISTVNARKENNEAYDALVAAEEAYPTFRDPGIIATHKATVLPRLQREQDEANRKLRTTLAVTSVAALATVWCFIKAGNLEEPVYEDKERIRFEGLVWLPGQRGGNLHVGLTYRFHG